MAIEWTENRWGTHSARAGRLLVLSVHYQDGGRDRGEAGWKFIVGYGIKGKKVYPNPEEAKDAAVVSARRLLKESLEALAE
jgi:hypothetical protein